MTLGKILSYYHTNGVELVDVIFHPDENKFSIAPSEIEAKDITELKIEDIT